MFHFMMLVSRIIWTEDNPRRHQRHSRAHRQRCKVQSNPCYLQEPGLFIYCPDLSMGLQEPLLLGVDQNDWRNMDEFVCLYAIHIGYKG